MFCLGTIKTKWRPFERSHKHGAGQKTLLKRLPRSLCISLSLMNAPPSLSFYNTFQTNRRQLIVVGGEFEKKKMLRAILALTEGRTQGRKKKLWNAGAHFYADSLNQLRPSLGTSISHFLNERSFKKLWKLLSSISGFPKRLAGGTHLARPRSLLFVSNDDELSIPVAFWRN